MTGKNSLRAIKIDGWTIPNPRFADNSTAAAEVNSEFLALNGFGSTTQQATVADALVSVGATWDLATVYNHLGGAHGSPVNDQQNAVHTIGSGYYQPYSIAYCAPDVVQGQTIVDQSLSLYLLPQTTHLQMNRVSCSMPMLRSTSMFQLSSILPFCAENSLTSKVPSRIISSDGLNYLHPSSTLLQWELSSFCHETKRTGS